MPNKVGKLKAKKARGASMASVKREVRSRTDPSNTTFTGRWPGAQRNSLKRSFEQERVRQLLRQVATSVFGYVRDRLGKTGEQEVQVMLVNERLLISTNDDESIDALHLALTKKAKKVALKEHENAFGKVLRGDWDRHLRSVRTARKLGRVLDKKRLDTNPAASLLRAMSRAKQVIEVLDLSDGDAEVVDNVHGRGKVILVKGSPLPHAEQKLVHALVLSGHTGAAEVYGKKRPCYGCSLTLKYVKEHGFPNLVFNPRPGGTWFPPMDAVIRNADIFGAERADVAAWFQEEVKKGYTAHRTGAGGDTAHDSESDSDDDD